MSEVNHASARWCSCGGQNGVAHVLEIVSRCMKRATIGRGFGTQFVTLVCACACVLACACCLKKSRVS